MLHLLIDLKSFPNCLSLQPPNLLLEYHFLPRLDDPDLIFSVVEDPLLILQPLVPLKTQFITVHLLSPQTSPILSAVFYLPILFLPHPKFIHLLL